MKRMKIATKGRRSIFFGGGGGGEATVRKFSFFFFAKTLVGKLKIVYV